MSNREPTLSPTSRPASPLLSLSLQMNLKASKAEASPAHQPAVSRWTSCPPESQSNSPQFSHLSSGPPSRSGGLRGLHPRK